LGNTFNERDILWVRFQIRSKRSQNIVNRNFIELHLKRKRREKIYIKVELLHNEGMHTTTEESVEGSLHVYSSRDRRKAFQKERERGGHHRYVQAVLFFQSQCIRSIQYITITKRYHSILLRMKKKAKREGTL
jgi:hypothetical protein